MGFRVQNNTKPSRFRQPVPRETHSDTPESAPTGVSLPGKHWGGSAVRMRSTENRSRVRCTEQPGKDKITAVAQARSHGQVMEPTTHKTRKAKKSQKKQAKQAIVDTVKETVIRTDHVVPEPEVYIPPSVEEVNDKRIRVIVRMKHKHKG